MLGERKPSQADAITLPSEADHEARAQDGRGLESSWHVPWNLHEPAVSQFHFTENLDLIAFVTMASDEGLWVILCPGPYTGSDLDLGGLPSWLLKDPRTKLRTTYKGFTRAMNEYFNHLVPNISMFQYTKGGPIIAVQIENEYGSYNMDKKYMAYVKAASPLLGGVDRTECWEKESRARQMHEAPAQDGRGLESSRCSAYGHSI